MRTLLFALPVVTEPLPTVSLPAFLRALAPDAFLAGLLEQATGRPVPSSSTACMMTFGVTYVGKAWPTPVLVRVKRASRALARKSGFTPEATMAGSWMPRHKCRRSGI